MTKKDTICRLCEVPAKCDTCFMYNKFEGPLTRKEIDQVLIIRNRNESKIK